MISNNHFARSALACALAISASGTQALSFQDVSSTAGFAGDNASWGHAWADYDRDGFIDILTHAHLQEITASITQLWHNNGDGTFSDVTVDAGLVYASGDTHAVTWGDFDKDGFVDLYLVNGSIKSDPLHYNKFWRNNGNGTFTEMAEAAGLRGIDARGRCVFAFDYNKDGQLDIFSTSFDRPDSKPMDQDLGNFLFRNDGGLVFSNQGITSGIDRSLAENRAAAWGDYNGDGRPDVLVTGPCVLFGANADGTYTDITAASGIDPSTQCSAASWADFDKDGDLDLYVVKGFSASSSDSLYRNNGNGTFTDVASTAGITTATQMKRGVAWGDLDNDGDLDIYVVSLTNGSKPNLLYVNNGDGTFTDMAASAGAGAQVAGNGSDVSLADFNNDGYLDVFVSNGEGNAKGPYVLLKNDGGANHWMKLTLSGKSSNANALMAKVKVEADLGSQYQWNLGPHHFLSQDSLPMHFGLGTDTGVNRVLIDWPNGAKQRVENVAADQTLVLTEGKPHWSDTPTFSQNGFYVWQNGKRWKLLWKGGNGSSAFAGKITTSGNFTLVTSKGFETDDVMTWTTKSIDFTATDDGRVNDSIEFETTGSSVTFTITQDGVSQPQKVYIGKYQIKPETLPLTLRR